MCETLTAHNHPTRDLLGLPPPLYSIELSGVTCPKCERSTELLAKEVDQDERRIAGEFLCLVCGKTTRIEISLGGATRHQGRFRASKRVKP